jgi:hypothetical protein
MFLFLFLFFAKAEKGVGKTKLSMPLEDLAGILLGPERLSKRIMNLN